MEAYLYHLLILGGIYLLLASSLNILVGLAGLVSLGHAAFFGLGAYTSALLSLHTSLSFPLLIIASGLLASLAALLVGFPALKLKDEFLAVVTLGLGLIFELLLKNLNFTGGPDGLYGLETFGLTYAHFIFIVWLCIFLCLFFTFRLKSYLFGLNFTALKENELTAQVLGIYPFPLKIFLFIISSFFAGLAGSIYAHYITFIGPNVFGLHTSILILCMVVLGGIGTLIGPLLGGSILFLLPEFLQPLADYQDIFYGALLIIILIFRPQGILGKSSLKGF